MLLLEIYYYIGGVVNLELKKTIKKMIIDKDIKQVDIATALGKNKQGFNNQLMRDNFRLSEIVEIANVLGYSVKLQFIDKETGAITEVDSN